MGNHKSCCLSYNKNDGRELISPDKYFNSEEEDASEVNMRTAPVEQQSPKTVQHIQDREELDDITCDPSNNPRAQPFFMSRSKSDLRRPERNRRKSHYDNFMVNQNASGYRPNSNQLNGTIDDGTAERSRPVLYKSSSCSTIFIDDSTVSQPNLRNTIKAVALAIYLHIKNRRKPTSQVRSTSTFAASGAVLDSDVYRGSIMADMNTIVGVGPNTAGSSHTDALTTWATGAGPSNDGVFPMTAPPVVNGFSNGCYQEHEPDMDPVFQIFDEKLHPLTREPVPDDYAMREPDHRTIYRFMRTLFSAAQLTSECAIVTLVYLERLMSYEELEMRPSNWRRLLLGAILLASKVWDDMAVWNVDFCQILKDMAVEDVNDLEREFLQMLQFNINVPSSVYAKYYFDLRALTENHDLALPLEPMNKEKALRLEALSSLCQNKVLEMNKLELVRTQSLDGISPVSQRSKAILS